MPRDFIDLFNFIASERLVRSGPERCHSTQFSGRKASSLALHSVPYGTCRWHAAHVLTLLRVLTLVLERLEPVRTRKILFGPDRRRHCYLSDWNIFRATWHVARDDITLCSRTADPIWIGPTTFDASKRWERGCVDVWMPTKWHVARAIGMCRTTSRNCV